MFSKLQEMKRCFLSKVLQILFGSGEEVLTTTSGRSLWSEAPSTSAAKGCISGGRQVNCCLESDVTLQKLLPI